MGADGFDWQLREDWLTLVLETDKTFQIGLFVFRRGAHSRWEEVGEGNIMRPEMKNLRLNSDRLAYKSFLGTTTSQPTSCLSVFAFQAPQATVFSHRKKLLKIHVQTTQILDLERRLTFPKVNLQ